jgi:hypothetical protein
MAATVVLDNEYATLWFRDDTKIVHHKVKKFIHGKTLQEMLTKGYETLKAKGCKKWLSDDALNGPLLKDDEAWAKTEWFPKVVKAGWKFWAIVLPQQVIGQMNMKRFIEDYAKAGITVNVFSDPDKALSWLASQ